MDCIFCKIANGEIPSNTVYEDKDFRVILDIAPANPGHCLVLPKTHGEDIFALSSEAVAQAHALAKRIATAVKAAVKADGINIVQNNGAAAGQSVSHYHIHIIPRFSGDGVQLNKEGKGLADEEFAKIKETIVKELNTSI
jgi:histidine triad (HIT) family protein